MEQILMKEFIPGPTYEEMLNPDRVHQLIDIQ